MRGARRATSGPRYGRGGMAAAQAICNPLSRATRGAGMSYTRGPIYTWTDSDERLHVWVAGEPDGYADSSWGVGYAERGEPVNGVVLPPALFDELVAMRWAQMTAAEREAASQRAVANWHGNGGCAALAESRGLVPFPSLGGTPPS